MTEQTGSANEDAREETTEGQAAEREDGLEAEQESAAAMDADVPQPPGADQTTEGQPS